MTHTLRMKSGGVPGRTVGLRTPSWWEWMSVSSRSSTRTFRFTASEYKQNTHRHEILLANGGTFTFQNRQVTEDLLAHHLKYRFYLSICLSERTGTHLTAIVCSGPFGRPVGPWDEVCLSALSGPPSCSYNHSLPVDCKDSYLCNSRPHALSHIGYIFPGPVYVAAHAMLHKVYIKGGNTMSKAASVCSVNKSTTGPFRTLLSCANLWEHFW